MADDDDHRRIEIALHEAGHAVISRVVGLIGGRATVVPHGTAGGRAWYRDDDGVKLILAALAGRAATEVILGRADEFGCSTDDAEVWRLLTTSPYIEREGWYAKQIRRELLCECRRLCRQHRAAIEAVAHELLAREMLSGWQIDQIVAQASGTVH
jgi:ATP-dependent Zn protease